MSKISAENFKDRARGERVRIYVGNDPVALLSKGQALEFIREIKQAIHEGEKEALKTEP